MQFGEYRAQRQDKPPPDGRPDMIEDDVNLDRSRLLPFVVNQGVIEWHSATSYLSRRAMPRISTYCCSLRQSTRQSDQHRGISINNVMRMCERLAPGECFQIERDGQRRIGSAIPHDWKHNAVAVTNI